MLVEDKGTREEDEKEQGQANELPISCLRPLCSVHPRSLKGFLSLSILRIVQKVSRMCEGCSAACAETLIERRIIVDLKRSRGILDKLLCRAP